MNAALNDLKQTALSLSPSDRVDLAQALWESVDDAMSEDDVIETALKRDRELSAGSVQGVSHADVMKAARQAIQ